MEGYEIEEIINQNKHGGLFRGRDNKTGAKVMIHRFFPYGQSNGGLGREDAKSYINFSRGLTGIKHPSLRTVIVAGTDPFDATPYVVNEWVDGITLDQVIANSPLEPANVIEIVRLIIELSIYVSGIIKEEGLWVDTDVSSIMVGTVESGSNITFRLAPRKWINPTHVSRKATPLTDLVTTLMNWATRKIGSPESTGLGAWIDWLKLNPNATLQEALQSLVIMTRGAKAQSFGQTDTTASQKFQSSSKRSKFVIASLIIGMLSACVALYFIREKKIAAADEAPATANQEAQASAAKPKTKRTEAQLTRDKIAERSLQLRKEAEEAAAKAMVDAKNNSKPVAKPPTPQVVKPPDQEPVAPPAQLTPEQLAVYSPTDTEYAKTLKSGTPFKLKGKLESAYVSTTGKSIYLSFSNPYKKGEIRGVTRLSNFTGEYKPETFDHMIGKTIHIDGTIYFELNDDIVVMFTDLSQITVR